MNLQEQFHAMEAETIQQFRREGRTEDLHLEFKTINASDFTNENDRKNLAKTVSGFANSAGGLIVWGVATDKKGECATGIQEIEGLSIFRKKLEEFAGNWVSPPVQGVLHKTIQISGPDAGCAITFVPESDSGPHMNNFERRYYKRNGSRFIQMEHYEVADMFGRRKRPKLNLNCRIVEARAGTVHSDEFVEYTVVVGIENSGKGTAKYPYLSFKVNEPFKISDGGLDGNSHFGLRKLPLGSHRDSPRFGGDANSVIHPSTVLPVTRITARMPKADYLKTKKVPDICYEIGAEDIDLIEGTHTLDRWELGEWLRKNGILQGVQL